MGCTLQKAISTMPLVNMNSPEKNESEILPKKEKKKLAEMEINRYKKEIEKESKK